MSGYAYIWEFEVRPEAQEEFKRHYGPHGTWVRLFRQAPGYSESFLLEDQAVAGRYLTIDRWHSESAYRTFRVQFAREFEALDKLCEALTIRETSLGTYRDFNA